MVIDKYEMFVIEKSGIIWRVANLSDVYGYYIFLLLHNIQSM